MQEIQAFHSSKSKLPEPPELPRETWDEERPVEEREALEFFSFSGVMRERENEGVWLFERLKRSRVRNFRGRFRTFANVRNFRRESGTSTEARELRLIWRLR